MPWFARCYECDQEVRIENPVFYTSGRFQVPDTSSVSGKLKGMSSYQAHLGPNGKGCTGSGMNVPSNCMATFCWKEVS
jgi:hypothetical protein